MADTPKPTFPMTDLTAPGTIEIEIGANHGALWVNVDAICVLRAYRAKRIIVRKDERIIADTGA